MSVSNLHSNRSIYCIFLLTTSILLTMNSFTLTLVAVLAMVVTSQIVDQVEQPVPQTLAEAMTVATGTYSVHFQKLPGELTKREISEKRLLN